MKILRSFVVFVLMYTLGLSFFPELRAFAECQTTPSERSTVLQEGNVDNCGDTNWDLQVFFGNYLYDEGEYDATGTCTGGYVKCDCTNVPLGFKAPTKAFVFVAVQEHEYQWWWSIKNYYQRILSNCSSGACQYAGYAGETDQTWVDPGAGFDDEFDDCGY